MRGELVAGAGCRWRPAAPQAQHAGDSPNNRSCSGVGRHVVQQRETCCAGECLVGVRQGGGVAVDDLDRRDVGEAFTQHRGEFVVDLDRRQVRHRLAEHVGGGAVAWADFEDVVAEVGVHREPTAGSPRGSAWRHSSLPHIRCASFMAAAYARRSGLRAASSRLSERAQTRIRHGVSPQTRMLAGASGAGVGGGGGAYGGVMCRNITELRGLEPAATAEEIEAAARQYVRKVSGITRPIGGQRRRVRGCGRRGHRHHHPAAAALPARRQPPKTVPPLRRPEVRARLARASEHAPRSRSGARRCTRCSTVARRCCCARAASARSVSPSTASRVPVLPDRRARPRRAGAPRTPRSARRRGAATAPRTTIVLRAGAKVVAAIAVNRPEGLGDLATLHIWTAESVRADRLDFRPKHRLTVLVVAGQTAGRAAAADPRPPPTRDAGAGWSCRSRRPGASRCTTTRRWRSVAERVRALSRLTAAGARRAAPAATPRLRRGGRCASRAPRGARERRLVGAQVAGEPRMRATRDQHRIRRAGREAVRHGVEFESDRAGTACAPDEPVADVAGAARRVDLAEADEHVVVRVVATSASVRRPACRRRRGRRGAGHR